MSESKNGLNLLGIVGIIGALLMIVGVFLSWMDLSISSSLFGLKESSSFTGMDVFSKDVLTFGDESFRFSDVTSYYYAPAVALACGVVALIATVLPVFLKGGISKALGALALILAVITIVISFLFYNDVSGYMFSENIGDLFSASLSIGAGLWVVIAGAVVTVIGGILDLAKDYS